VQTQKFWMPYCKSKCLVHSQDTAQKVLNSLSPMMQTWMFSCFISPLVRNSVVRTCNGLFTADDYLKIVELYLILNRKTFLSRDQEKSRKQDRHARCFMQVIFAWSKDPITTPRHHHNRNAAATAKDLFCLSL